MSTFREFVDKKTRESKKQLEILGKILKKEGLGLNNFLDEDDPYLFVENPGKDTTFDGVRLYKIGDTIAYRIQKEPKTHPYGKAYSLNVEEMFADLLTDEMNEEEAGHEIMKTVVQEVKSFFDKSASAEKEIRSQELESDKDPMGKVMVRNTGTDYSNQVTSSS